MDVLHALLAVGSGGLVGFSLGLLGGGGSILAVPLLLYVVGVQDPHIAIGTSALAVAANAIINLLPHARAGHVRWSRASIFALAGIVGAFAGSSLGKVVDGQHLLALFAVVMLVIAGLMQRAVRQTQGHAHALDRPVLVRLVGVGLGAGSLSGFFGIGGGFLIVPGLILACDMATIDAIGSSLVAVAAFGLATSANYALSGLVDWQVAGIFLLGGGLGGWGGTLLAGRLARRRTALNRIFGAVVASVALYILARAWVSL